MDLGLKGRTVVITGASRGIGRACARLCAAEGAQVALGARSPADLEALSGELEGLGAAVLVEAADMVAPGNVDRLVERALEAFGSVDGLVACVGSTPLGDFDALDDATWLGAFEMKFLSSVRALRAVLAPMRSQGRGAAVLVAGNSTFVPDPLLATSAVVNGALGRMVGALARQVAPQGITVNCVSPGPVDTDRYRALVSVHARSGEVDEETAAAKLEANIPRGRVGSPEEVAAVAVSLLSPAFSHVNGQNILVDGAQGWSR